MNSSFENSRINNYPEWKINWCPVNNLHYWSKEISIALVCLACITGLDKAILPLMYLLISFCRWIIRINESFALTRTCFLTFPSLEMNGLPGLVPLLFGISWCFVYVQLNLVFSGCLAILSVRSGERIVLYFSWHCLVWGKFFKNYDEKLNLCFNLPVVFFLCFSRVDNTDCQL
mgnify:CR=1 FL=1